MTRKTKKLNALQRLRRTLRTLQHDLAAANFATQRANTVVEQRDTLIKDARQALANSQAFVVELTAERDRILRLVDQFLSVQILTHGTELRIGSASSAPSVLRPGLAPNVFGGTTGVYPVKPDALVTAAQVVEKEHAARQASYRRPMYSV